MENRETILQGKRVLIVDDEPDVLGALDEMLSDCKVDTAGTYSSACRLMETTRYDAAILDIMGVQGYELLSLANQKGIPVLMLTAHALSPENLAKSIKEGARAYVPKDKISEIRGFLEDILEETPRRGRLGRWFSKLEPYFEKRFGPYWKERSDPEFWKKYHC